MSRHSNLTGLKAQQKTVTVAGTPEKAGTFNIASGVGVVVKAKAANVGTIFIGGSSAEALDTARAFKLTAGQGISLQVDNLDRIWLDTTNSGDGVELIFESDAINVG